MRGLAENGDRESQYQLGNAYCCGTEGGFWDTAEAVKWWCKAAAQGQKDAEAAIARGRHLRGSVEAAGAVMPVRAPA